MQETPQGSQIESITGPLPDGFQKVITRQYPALEQDPDNLDPSDLEEVHAIVDEAQGNVVLLRMIFQREKLLRQSRHPTLTVEQKLVMDAEFESQKVRITAFKQEYGLE